MQRGSLVRVTDREYKASKRKVGHTPPHLVGGTGIALERIKSSGWIRVLQEDKESGLLMGICYPPETLDVLEPPTEL